MREKRGVLTCTTCTLGGISLTLGCVPVPLSSLLQRTAISCTDSDTLKSLIPLEDNHKAQTYGLGGEFTCVQIPVGMCTVWVYV